MYGTLKKIIAFAGSKEGLLKKSLLFAFLSGLFAALQFAALFIVVEALVSDNRDRRFIWISLGIMAVSLVGRIITTYFSTMEQTETGYSMVCLLYTSLSKNKFTMQCHDRSLYNGGSVVAFFYFPFRIQPFYHFPDCSI